MCLSTFVNLHIVLQLIILLNRIDKKVGTVLSLSLLIGAKKFTSNCNNIHFYIQIRIHENFVSYNTLEVQYSEIC